ncbi:Serine/threonine protein phosphatase 2A 57 kDa regulatory subunit B' theta isoform domain protein [Babesia bovis T2Bo]|uniref:Protein phosphatase B regulatory subunit, putative n=1 Tax=Babesia bovis TaxID=5865 RepID=A7AV35_BABBO|nr:Serine/threonine protein phosphatase 2A 57 kDa regulatory subunit B' theta isoform domain protein [Babesia bovis T2Bo]EDO05661.1 Serine/threonine protein phosphatase 2A 57 kDa regulatory subunit B' theta isoform domain protein [Babesia bovis T2Bo]|eukprot:XP_001609229.1 protein phosphatase B regulatory subunit [Babesia bovis T2Bo]
MYQPTSRVPSRTSSRASSRTSSYCSSRESSIPSSRGSRHFSDDEDHQVPSQLAPQPVIEGEPSSGWWLYNQTRRLIRSIRDRKLEDVQKPVSEGDTRSDVVPQRSLFRMLTGLFIRSEESDDDTHSKGSVQSSPASPDLRSSLPSRRHRRKWRSRSVSSRGDSDSERTLSDSDSISNRVYRPNIPSESWSDNEFQIHRSLPYGDISTIEVDNIDPLDGAVGIYNRSLHNSRPFESHGPRAHSDDTNSRGSSDSRRSLWLIECFDSLRKTNSDASPDGHVVDSSMPYFQTGIYGQDRDGHGSSSSRETQSDDDHVEDRSSRSSRNRERRLFSLRGSISSLRRNLSSPKSRADKDSDSDNSSKRLSMLGSRSGSNRDSSAGSLSDGEMSPGIVRSPSHGAVTGSPNYWRADTPVARDDWQPRGQISSSLASRKERVISLTSNTSPDLTTGCISLSKWDLQSVRKLEEVFSSLPLLKDTPLPARGDLFQRKLIACQTVIDFNFKRVLQRAIELKRQTLLEIIDYISTARNCLNEAVLRDVIDMVSANVFRSLPPRSRKCPFSNDIDDDEPTLEKSWPHLQIVYDVFLRVVVSNEVTSKMAKNMIDKPFVTKLLGMLNSEDQRERDYLKTILHRIYGKIMSLRNFIRKSIDNVFITFIYETDNPYGITELLEILGSIINGFAIPLKEEHKVYLEKSLAPLHKPSSVRSYHAALSYCMIQYINKDRSLACPIIKAILKFWPTTSAQNEILFLNELEEVLSLTEATELTDIVRQVAIRLSQCTASTHFQVAERALYIWNNDRVCRLLNMHKDVVYPYMVPAIKENIDNHWNDVVRNLTYNVSKLLSDNDMDLYSSCGGSNSTTRSMQSFNLTPFGSFGSGSPVRGMSLGSMDQFLSPREIGHNRVV